MSPEISISIGSMAASFLLPFPGVLPSFLGSVVSGLPKLSALLLVARYGSSEEPVLHSFLHSFPRFIQTLGASTQRSNKCRGWHVEKPLSFA